MTPWNHQTLSRSDRGYGSTMNPRTSFLVLALSASSLAAQVPSDLPQRPSPQVTLSLAEALSQARINSPAYRQAQNDAAPAGWAVRNAYGDLIPQLSVNGGFGYTGSGQSSFGGSLFNQTSPSLSSSYGISLNMTLNGSVLTAPAVQQANQRATDADIQTAARTLENDVTAQYLTALQAMAQTDVAHQQVARNREFLALAQARFEVGQGTLLDVRQAEVTLGQSELDVLRNTQAENEAKLELLRRMGVELPVPVTELGLSETFSVTEPTLELQALLAMAEDGNPTLRSTRARERAAVWGARAARSQYLPSLNVSASWNGFTQEFTNSGLLLDRALNSAMQNASNCEFQNALIGQLPGGGVPGFPNMGMVADCNDFAGLDATGESLLPENHAAIVNSNNVWPLDFTTQPFRASVSISLPIFTGFSRTLSVSRANAQREDAEEVVRATRLQVRAAVQARYLEVQTSHRAIAVQDANQRSAREQLELARERFRLGNGSALEVADAQAAVSRAEADYVNAVYAYHRALAAIEFAVGRPLR